MDKRGIMEPDQRTHRTYTSSPWYLFHMWTSAQLEQRAEVPTGPKANIQSATHERWRLAQMSMQISVGARGAFPHILNICDIFKHWLVHRGNYKFIVTIMTCSSQQKPGCLNTAWCKDVEIAALSEVWCVMLCYEMRLIHAQCVSASGCAHGCREQAWARKSGQCVRRERDGAEMSVRRNKALSSAKLLFLICVRAPPLQRVWGRVRELTPKKAASAPEKTGLPCVPRPRSGDESRNG